MSGGFQALGLLPELIKATETLNWLLPTDVQDEAIPLILGGGDVMVAAETGSGKTAAFCLPILQCVVERLRFQSSLQPSASTTTTTTTTTSSSASSGQVNLVDVRLNENDRDPLLTIDATHPNKCKSQAEHAWIGGRATHGVRRGKYYFEAQVQGNGICRFGWSTMAAHRELGRDSFGFGYGGTGMRSFNNEFVKYGDKYSHNDVVGCYVDLTNKTISFSVNGVHHGTAFAIPDTVSQLPLFPAFVFKNAGAIFNFGQTAFKHNPQDTEYRGLASALFGDVISSVDRQAFTSNSITRKPMAVIIEPARELAEQVLKAIRDDLAKYLETPAVKTILVVGGENNKQLANTLAEGCDIVVGTLGKMFELVKSGTLDLSHVRFFVLDEADRLTDPESMTAVTALYRACPESGTGENRLQVCFFSATLHSPAITKLAETICVNPTWVDLKGVDSVPEAVHHVVCRVDVNTQCLPSLWTKTNSVLDNVHPVDFVTPILTTIQHNNSNNNNNKESGAMLGRLFPNQAHQWKDIKSALVKVLKQQLLVRVIDKFKMSQCIIFCRTNVDCNNLETFLCQHGGGRKFTERVESGKEHAYSCCVLAGMREANERRRNLDAFRNGDVRLLICTDVAARGIDIEGLPFVINFTLPDEIENYIHRVGRVGRADRMGLAISLVAVAADGSDCQEKVWFHRCSNRGQGCLNRNLKDNGGCCIWYDEAELLEKVKQRLQVSELPMLLDDLSLPPELAALDVKYGEDSASAVIGGGKETSTFEFHTEQLAATVQELQTMEFQAQNMFLQFRQQFH